jgi:hypothetical protein
MSPAPTRTLAPALLLAWQAALKATGDATLKQQCLQQEPDLLPRFNKHYRQLEALPRRMRRSLQRQWKRSLAGLSLLLALGQTSALAASVVASGLSSCIIANRGRAGKALQRLFRMSHATYILAVVKRTAGRWDCLAEFGGIAIQEVVKIGQLRA